MKDLFLIPVWKRPEITRICIENLLEQGEDNILCVASNPEDMANVVSLGVRCIHAENRPLGAKINAGLSAAVELPWENVVTLGSDDLVKPGLFDVYNHYDELDVVGVDKIYFVNTKSGLSELLANCRIGAGRRIKRKVVEALGYKLWTDQMNKTLDRDSNQRMSKKGFKVITVHPIPLIVGLKSEVNIWPFAAWNFSKRVKLDEVLEGLPARTVQSVHDLISKNISLHLQKTATQ